MSVRKAILMLVVLLAGAWWLHSIDSRSGDRTGPEAQLLANIAAPRLRAIIVNPGDKGRELELSRKDTTDPWRATQNPNALIDRTQLARMVEALLHLRSHNSIAPDEQESLAAYGLEHPELTVKVRYQYSGSNIEHLLSFGGKNEISGRRFLQLDSEKTVYLVDDYLFGQLNRDLESMRDRTPFLFEPNTVSQLEVSTNLGSKRSYTLKRSTASEFSDGRWTITEGERSFTGDAELIERKLREVALLKVRTFIDPPLKLDNYGLESPVAKLKLTFNGGATLNLSFGEVTNYSTAPDSTTPERSFFAKTDELPSVYELSKRSHLEFLQPLEFFRSRKPLSQIPTSGLKEICFRYLSNSAESNFVIKVTDPSSGSLGVGKHCQSADSINSSNPAELHELINRLLNFPIISTVEGQRDLNTNPHFEAQIYTGADAAPFIFTVGSVLNTGNGGPDTQAPRYAKFGGPGGLEQNTVVSSAEVQQLIKFLERLGSEVGQKRAE